jgi:hypothetical protein
MYEDFEFAQQIVCVLHLTNVGTDKTADEKTAIRKERAGQKHGKR